ncbi:hypothetical protein ONZ45_g17515 [Pleurotus djamor]|nr:hypothetical protein ONZ45_g17515 [Pleurotus djamor]
MSRIIINGAPKVPDGDSEVPVPQPRVEIQDFVKNDKWLSLFIQALGKPSLWHKARTSIFRTSASAASMAYLSDLGLVLEAILKASFKGIVLMVPLFSLIGIDRTLPHMRYVGISISSSGVHLPFEFKQFLQQAAMTIALEYNSDEWVRAAETMRLPYWDWASAPIPPDQVIAMPQITITTSSGPQTVANPFWGYVFHPIDPSFTGRWALWRKTLRQPSGTGANAQDNVETLKRTLGRVAPQVNRDTYLLFSIDNWDDFSNHTTSAGSSLNSLEGIHDSLHVNIGGSGHMSSVPHAAHDPIFYLHHCNIDRLLALWQAIHFDVEVTDGSSGGGTWTIPANQRIGVNTPLTPFWRTQDSNWVSTTDSAGVQDFTTFGYTYPEFKGLDLSDKEAVRTAISQKVEELYAPRRARPRIRGALASVGMSAPSAPLTSYDQEWTVKIACNQYECDQSFFVLLFLGNPPENSEEWLSASNLIASQGFFVNSTPEQCENCKKHQEEGDLVEEFVHLSELLLERNATEGTLDEAKVVPYLKDGLHHRILKIDGTVIDAPDFKSMKVEVLSTPLNTVKHSPLPHLGRAHKYFAF